MGKPRVNIELTDDGGFVVRTTQDTKKGFKENIQVAKSFAEAMKKAKKSFKEGKSI